MNSDEHAPPSRVLSVQPTQQCNAECDHCGSFSNPRVKVALEPALAEDAIRQAAREGYKDVVFTGGEPTLSGRWLLSAFALAKSLGFFVRLATNGWWAKTPQIAAQRVREFVDAGLDEVEFSTGDQHARFVPLAAVIRGSLAAMEIGLRVTVIIELVKTRVISKEEFMVLPEILEARAAFPNAVLNVHQSPWMPIKPDNTEQYPYGVAVHKGNVARRGGCSDIIGTTTISPDGTISACCGIGMRLIPELQLGNIAETSIAEAVRKAESDPLKQWIRSAGPENILAWASTHDPTIEWEHMYGHRCQACIRMYTDPKVRQVLRDHRKDGPLGSPAARE